MSRRAALAATLLASLAGCAQLQEALLWSKGRSALAEGVRQYDDGQHLAAAKSLQAALELGLKDGERANAHKHLAFIHCAAGRSGPCRDEFRKALSADPALALSPAESGHPVWGPVFRSAKAQGGTLSVGLKQYENGEYDAAAKSLQSALELGLSDRERAIAHKHLAFMHCSAGRERACREGFRQALAADPNLTLDAAEAGHPMWGRVFLAARAEGVSLAAALKQYEDGDYDTSAKNLQGAIDRGLPPGERATAHKHLAFIHCASSRERACREEFRKALALDPALELAPAEAGHPAWGPVFRSLKGKK